MAKTTKIVRGFDHSSTSEWCLWLQPKCILEDVSTEKRFKQAEGTISQTSSTYSARLVPWGRKQCTFRGKDPPSTLIHLTLALHQVPQLGDSYTLRPVRPGFVLALIDEKKESSVAKRQSKILCSCVEINVCANLSHDQSRPDESRSL